MADQDQHRLTDGVSAGTIRAFLNDLKREFPETHADMTTEDACKQLVVPRTKEPNCAYVDLLRRSSPKSVSKATVFVSHAWRYKITDVLNTLLEFAEEQDEKDGNPVFFWFDLFMNNQNANITANLPQDWWSTTFKQSIANIGRVLLVLMPWHDPVPLTRAWCLWEIFCGISNKGTEVDIRLPEREEQALEAAIQDEYKSVTNMLVRVQAQRAEARSPHDKTMIFQAIETWAGGFGAVNQAVKDQLREWCLSRAIAAVEAMIQRGEDETSKFAGLCHNVGAVLTGFGDTERAIEYYEKALRICLKTEGEKGESVARLYNDLGEAYRRKGEYDKAIEYYEQAREIQLETLGEKHPSTAVTYNNLGIAYDSKGEYDRAILYYEKAREIRVEALGKKHPSTADTYNNLGGAYADKGEYDKAIQYFEKTREIQVETLGEKHPSTAMTLENIGVLHDDRGDKERACEYIQRAAGVLEEALGPDHPNALKAKRNLQRLLGTGSQLQGRDEQAEHSRTSDQTRSATTTSSPSSKTAAQHDEAPPPPPSGWLLKRKRKGRSFLPRWFTLTGDELVYSKTATGRVRRRIPLSTAQSVEFNQDSKELHVCVPGRTFVLRLDARSDASLKDWCSALSSRISSSDE